jgi:hypothetical protein
MERKTFDEILMESVDEILNTLGGSAKCIIYLYLSKELGISKEQIPNRISEFVETLRSIFGVGSRCIELQLMKEIEAKTKISFPFRIQASSLQDYVIFVRQEYMQQINR